MAGGSGRIGGTGEVGPDRTGPSDSAAADHSQLQAATRDFEAMLWETVLRSLRSAAEGLSGRAPDQGRDIYNTWLDQALAREMVNRDGGVADLLYKQLQWWQARRAQEPGWSGPAPAAVEPAVLPPVAERTGLPAAAAPTALPAPAPAAAARNVQAGPRGLSVAGALAQGSLERLSKQ